LDKLSWRDTERLFLRLLALQADLTYAKSYGVPGQDQEGIDVYARLRGGSQPGGASNGSVDSLDLPARPYLVLQSKNVKDLTASDIDAAVTKFLNGSWPENTSHFYYATTFDLTEKNLDAAWRAAADRLAEKGISLVPWGAEHINELLRDQPKLVARFFDRSWVEPFCGAGALKSVPDVKLSPAEVRNLRDELRKLYQAAFASMTAPSPAPGRVKDPFVVLSVTPQPDAQLGAQLWQEESHRGFDRAQLEQQRSEVPQVGEHAAGFGADIGEDLVSAFTLGRPRPSLRPVRALLDGLRPESGEGGATAADEWLSAGDRNLIVGVPGAGKSSLLRFIATDLLSPEPQSAALQRHHGERLPVWLSFGFLCHHLEDNDSNSLPSAVRAWLTSHGRGDLFGLVEQALEDERLLLLIDGIDEWSTEDAANNALGVIETFLGHGKAAVLLTSRPYAVARLPFALVWRRADIAPLDLRACQFSTRAMLGLRV
jgi:hypothetical protein